MDAALNPALAYIPADRRFSIARGAALPDSAQGSVLFADISGFTPLTEALAVELGPRRGAEELTRHLDRVYGALIEQVNLYRGSVTGFAGDAITCFFDGDTGLRATAAALAMQEAMRTVAGVTTPGGTAVELAVKLGIASGRVRRFLVGDPSVQVIDVPAGATLERMAEAEHHAHKGDVVLSPEALAAEPGAFVIAERRLDPHTGVEYAVVSGLTMHVEPDPWPEQAPGALTEEQVRPWVLPGVYEHLRAGQGRYLAELRPCVALFLSFGGIDYDGDPDAGRKLDAYIRWVQAVLARREGTLIQVSMGDKGSYLYGAFGAPTAHDDDAARAAAAVLELRATPPDLAYAGPIRAGISRGRMRVGDYGGPTRRTYGVLGDDVNLAARLMSRAAPGEVLVSKRIALAVERRFDMLEVGAVPLKGKSEPIVAYRLLDRKQTGGTRQPAMFGSPLVGREREVASLAAALDSVQQRRGQVVRIQGAQGIGKSHLSAELSRLALVRGMVVAEAVCQATGESAAYEPWRDLFRALLGLNGEEAAQQQAAAVEEWVRRTDPGWLLRLPLLGDLLSLPIPDNSTTAAFEPKVRQAALFELVVEMLRAITRQQPAVLLLDDAQWIDEASRALTAALGRSIAEMPLLFAVAHRPPEPDEDILSELDALEMHTRLDLDTLSPEGVAALVKGRLGGAAAPLVLSVVHSQAQGNPFFTEEVVDSLREAGSLVRREGGTWAFAETAVSALQSAGCLVRRDGEWVLGADVPLSSSDLGLPDSVEGVVLSRIDRLPERHKLTLKVASVVGRLFPFDLLARAHPTQPDEGDLLGQMDLLQGRDLTRLESPVPRPVYVFKHNVTHDVAYNTLLFDQRRQLHRSIGEVMESLSPDAVPQVAYHSYLGEDWPRALRYQTQAGQQAQRLSANHQAIEHFRKALAAAGALPSDEQPGLAASRQVIDSSLGQLLVAVGQYDEALEHLDSALETARALEDVEAEARACRWIARLYENRGDYPNALEWIERGLEAMGDRESAAAAEMLAIAGLIGTRQGQHEQAERDCRRALDMAEKLGEQASAAFAYNARGITWILRGDNRRAAEDFERSLELYEATGNIHGQATSHNQLANAVFNMGRWTEAEHHYRRARQIFNQTGAVYNVAIADNNLGEVARNQGRTEEAIESYRSALRSMEQIGGSAYVIAVLTMNIGAALVAAGDIGEARSRLDTSRAMFDKVKARDFDPELHRHYSAAASREDDPEEAQAQAQLALDTALELGDHGEEGIAKRLLAELAHARGDHDEAERLLLESIDTLAEAAEEHELGRARLALAELYADPQTGRRAEAAEMLALCAPVFESLGAAPEIARVTALRESMAQGDMS